MIKHILKIIWAQRKSNWLIGIELLLVSVCVWYIADYLYVTATAYYTPIGYDIRHTYQLQFGSMTPGSEEYIPEETKETTTGEDLLEIFRRLRTLPGIEAASMSELSVPYAPGNSYYPVKMDSTQVLMHTMWVTPDFFWVFKCRGLHGETPEQLEALLSENTRIVSEKGAAELAGSPAAAIGREIRGDDEGPRFKVAAVTGPLRSMEFRKEECVIFNPLSDKRIAGRNYELNIMGEHEFCIRVSPGKDVDFIAANKKEIAKASRVGNVFLRDIKPMSRARDTLMHVSGALAEVRTRIAVMVFLMINIFLGITGTFWVRTTARKGEMGLRVALGSPVRSLHGLLIKEGLLLLTLASIPAWIVCLNLFLVEIPDTKLMPLTPLRFFIGVAATYGLLASMIVVGIWYPSRQVVKLEPAEALHYE